MQASVPLEQAGSICYIDVEDNVRSRSCAILFVFLLEILRLWIFIRVMYIDPEHVARWKSDVQFNFNRMQLTVFASMLDTDTTYYENLAQNSWGTFH